MCWSAYIASDVELPLVPWIEEAPEFHVELAESEIVEALRRSLTKPHVYYVGAHGGCSCDFQHQAVPPEDEVDRTNAAAARRARSAFADYLAAAVASGGPLEFIAGRMGEEHMPATGRVTVTPDFWACLSDC